MYDDRSTGGSGGDGGGGDVRDGAIRSLMQTRSRTEVTLKQLDFMISEYDVSRSFQILLLLSSTIKSF